MVCASGISNIACLFGYTARSGLILGFAVHDCDCVDYLFYRLAHNFDNITLLNDQYCYSPDYLYNEKV